MYRASKTLLMVILLSGCGTMPEERAISGAGLGAAAGTVVGAVTGLSLVEGAALGAAGGAITGVLTDPGAVNFGRPLWKAGINDGHGRSARGHSTVAQIQTELSKRGYDVGSRDGIMGPKTEAAIKRYQKDNGLPIDGQATPELIAQMRQETY